MSGNDYTSIDKHFVEGTAKDNLTTRSTYNEGARGDLPLYHRFVIIETIFDPTTINDEKVSYFEHTLGVTNIQYAKVLPRNSVIAKPVLDSTHAITAPMFLFPFFPPSMSLPCKPGEHIWVMFEHPSGKKTDMGYWMCRIVEPNFVDDVNHTHAPRSLDDSYVPSLVDVFDGKDDPKYEFRNGKGTTKNNDRYTVAETAPVLGTEKEYENMMFSSDGGKLSVYEPVPRYRKRPGDITFEGTNNSLIVLGRDRTGAAAKYTQKNGMQVVESLPDDDDQKPGSGMIDIVVGRGQTGKTLGKKVDNHHVDGSKTGNKELAKAKKDLQEREGDPDLANDRSRIYVSQRTKPDKNFKITQVLDAHSTKSGVKDDDGYGAIIVKSDKLRLVARKDVVILVTGATERDEDGNVKEVDADPSKCASIIIRTNGDIIFTPSSAGVVKLGGDDADKAVLCTTVNNKGSGGQVVASPIVDTMAGAQGASDGLNGTFARKVLLK